MKKLILPLCAALLLCACGNKLSAPDKSIFPDIPDTSSDAPQSDPESTPDTSADPVTPPESSQPEDTPAEPAVISAGLWWSAEEGDVRSDTYYEIHDDGTGFAASQKSGQKLPLTVSGDGKTFTLNVAPDVTPADTVYSAERISDDMIVMTAQDGTGFTWTFCDKKTLDDFSFFSNDELIRLAQEYYNALHPDSETPCTAADAFIDTDGTVYIDLYDDNQNHNILDEYRADRFTAKALDKNGAEIYLTLPPKTVITDDSSETPD